MKWKKVYTFIVGHSYVSDIVESTCQVIDTDNGNGVSLSVCDIISGDRTYPKGTYTRFSDIRFKDDERRSWWLRDSGEPFIKGFGYYSVMYVAGISRNKIDVARNDFKEKLGV